MAGAKNCVPRGKIECPSWWYARSLSDIAIRDEAKEVLPSATPGDFRITGMLTFAGVVPPLD
jgi:hypothetical protein